MTKSKSQVLKEEFYKKFVKDLGNMVEPVFLDPVGSVGPIWSFIEQALTQQKSEIIREIKGMKGKTIEIDGKQYLHPARERALKDVIDHLKK